MRNNALTYTRETKQRGRQLRANMSASELLVWSCLEKKKLGFKFRKQHPVAGYFLDFYCAEAALCIEIDGPEHEGRKGKDAERDAKLAALGVLTLRIPTGELWEAEGRVFNRWLDFIQKTCEERSGREAFSESAQ